LRNDWIGSAWTADKTSFISDIVSVVSRRPVPATCQKKRTDLRLEKKKKKNVIEDVVSLIERRDEWKKDFGAHTGGREVVANSRGKKTLKDPKRGFSRLSCSAALQD
jgi:hypothetical protein